MWKIPLKIIFGNKAYLFNSSSIYHPFPKNVQTVLIFIGSSINDGRQFKANISTLFSYSFSIRASISIWLTPKGVEFIYEWSLNVVSCILQWISLAELLCSHSLSTFISIYLQILPFDMYILWYMAKVLFHVSHTVCHKWHCNSDGKGLDFRSLKSF